MIVVVAVVVVVMLGEEVEVAILVRREVLVLGIIGDSTLRTQMRLILAEIGELMVVLIHK
jgi:hypothetical protein